jgi:RNA polymerase sigma-70 factor (ECF subfamily)
MSSRLCEREQVVEHPCEQIAADESPEDVLRACADLGNRQAWDRFLRRFHPLIVATVVRTVRRYTLDSESVCDDLAQDVYLKLSASGAKVLRNFRPLYPGAVFGFVKVIAANVVHDHFKSRAGRVPEYTALPEDTPARDETAWRLLLRSINDLLKKRAVTQRDRHIFWLYYRQGMSAKEIAALSSLNLTVKGVESVIVRLNQLVREAFRNGER